MTADEFFDWGHRPENRDRRFELERGQVIELPLGGERHGFVCANACRLLLAYAFERRQGYALSNGTGLILERDPDTVRGPDVVLYTATRRFDELRSRFPAEPPTLAVEVLSPDDRWPEATRRVTDFLRHGIVVVWLVDPDAKAVAVHRADQSPLVFEGGDEWTWEEVLPGFRCRAADLFHLPGATP